MTPEEQRIAIAEVCGWAPVSQVAPPHGEFYEKFLWEKDDTKNVRFVNLPNYLTDLNAIREAEQVIRAKAQLIINNWLDNLCIITNGESAEMDGSYKEIDAMVSATAAQRAEAFCRTLWPEKFK